jgi:hypothetical protein
VIAIAAGAIAGGCSPPVGIDEEVEAGADAAHALAPTPPTEDVLPDPSAVAIPGELDLSALAERTRAAFFESETGWTGGGTAYASEVDGEEIRVTALQRSEPTEDLRRSAPFTLARAQIRWGELDLSQPGPPTRAEDGTLAIAHGPIVEVLVNERQGLHQSFRIDEAPAGATGDLVVSMRATGLPFALADQSGLHFRASNAPGAPLGVRYGHATLVDAERHETAVTSVWSGGAIVLRVPEAALASATFPVVLDPVIGPEVTFGITSYVASSARQTAPRIASLVASTQSAVVWLDERRRGTHVFASRYSRFGAVLDPIGLQVETSSASATSVDVAAGGGTYLVVWTDTGGVRAALLPTSGAAGAMVTIADGTGATSARVAFDGTSFVTVWATGGDLRAARVSTAGVPEAPVDLRVTPGTEDAPALDCSATGCLVAWRDAAVDTGDVRAMRIDPALVPIDAAPIDVDVATSEQGAPAVLALAASRYAIAWNNGAPTGGRVRAAIIDATGARGAPASLTTANASAPDLASFGARVFASWTDDDSSAVRVQELGATGGPIGTIYTPSVMANGSPYGIVLTYDGVQLVAAWSSYATAAGYDVRAGRIAITSGVSDVGGVVVTTAGATQLEAVAAWGGTEWLVVWTESYGASGKDILGARVRADGTLHDTTGFVIVSNGTDDRLGGVASTGTGWIVASDWYRLSGSAYRGDVQTRRIQPTGGLDVSRTVRTPYAYDPAIAATADRYLVAWNEGSGYFSRLDASGVLLDTTPRAGPSGSTSLDATSVTSDGATFFLAAHSASDSLRIATVSSGGTISTPTVLGLGTGTSRRDHDVAAGGGTFLALWSYRPSVSSSARYLAAQRAGTGAALVGSQLAITGAVPSSYASTPRLTWDGTAFLAGWTHQTSATGVPSLRATRIRTDGTVDDPDGTPIVASLVDVAMQDLASDGAGHVLLVYAGYSTTAGSTRTHVRLLDMGTSGTAAIGAACTSAWDCASGFCADGFCCDTACGGAASDCSACSVARGATMDGHCAPVSAGLVCRASAGTCDVAESCDGTSLACPADLRAAAGTLCGATATDLCDLDDLCDGTSTSCRTTARAAAGTTCRPAAGDCDVAETCSGSSAACPADALATSGATCRSGAGACDVAERCTGTSPVCPTDQFLPSTTTCRESRGVCDLRERCTGTGAACPADVLVSASTVCRTARGLCDAADTCSGRDADCPRDLRTPAGTVCRPLAGACDIEEACDGVAVACPEDFVIAHGTVCRDATGVCDVAEACDGVSPACIDDVQRANGSSCDDGLVCNGLSECQSGACVDGAPLTCSVEGASCDERLGRCEVGAPASCACSAVGAGHAPVGAAWAWVAGVVLVFWRVRRRRGSTRSIVLAAVAALGAIGCVCAPGQLGCDGVCTDVSVDSHSCGRCGNVCLAGQTCVDGACTGIRSTGRSCGSDAACDDRNVCNGIELCVHGGCRAGLTLTCDDGHACTDDRCSEAAHGCVSTPATDRCSSGQRCTGRGATGCDP